MTKRTCGSIGRGTAVKKPKLLSSTNVRLAQLGQTLNVSIEGDSTSDCEDPVTVAMGIHLISDRIFGYMSLNDLLNCGRVNKQWQEHSRSYLRTKRKCLLILPNCNACKKFKELGQLVQNSSHIPFNGFDVKNACDKHRHACPRKKDCIMLNNRKLMNVLLESVTVKYLKLELDESVCRAWDPGLVLLSLVFRRQSKNIEEICVTRVPNFKVHISRVFEITSILKKNWLPNLKVLKPPDGLDLQQRNAHIIREFIAASSHLQNSFNIA